MYNSEISALICRKTKVATSNVSENSKSSYLLVWINENV